MDALPQLGLVAVLVLVNALLAGTEMALVSLRQGQVERLEATSSRGALLARLVREPNRFLATIQIGITLAGFLASAAAAVALAEPLVEPLAFLGGAARATAVILVTLVLSYITLVLGELAPKRIAMQRAEGWALAAARPLSWMSAVARPVVWLLSISTDLVVRVLGGDPTRRQEDISEEELRDLLVGRRAFSDQQRGIVEGVFEVSTRTLREVVRPRPEVLVLDASAHCHDALATMVEAGRSRAPVSETGALDDVVGVVHLRDLVLGAGGPVRGVAKEIAMFPETAEVLDVLHAMRDRRAQLALVIDEHGAVEGIVTVEDLVEELVGEIYDESDEVPPGVVHHDDGSLSVPGSYPLHDLERIGLPEAGDGAYATVAGYVLDRLGHIPDAPGEVVHLGGWELHVTAVGARTVDEVRAVPPTS